MTLFSNIMVQSDLEEQSSQGLFTPSGRDDILAKAIGKPDRDGRVLGEPRELRKKNYWGQKSRRRSAFPESREEIVAMVREECEAKIAEQVAEQVAYRNAQIDSQIASQVAEQVEQQLAAFRAQLEAMQNASTVNLNFPSASSKPNQV